MKEILFNLALIDTMNFCKANGVDPSGTYLKKCARGFTYVLYREKDNVGVLTTTFYKSQVPTHFIHKINSK